MKHEPIEISKAATRRQHRVAPRAGRMARQLHVQPDSSETVVIDEAFADFQSACQSTPALVSNITLQLRALDRQREQLAQLLRNVEGTAISG